MTKQLVVVQLLPELNNGGVERGTIEVANYLANNNITSIIVSAGGSLLDKLVDGVEHIELNVGKKSLFTIRLISTLKRVFKEKQVDIVHARSRLPAWIAHKAIAKIKTNKPKFITTVHGLYSIKKYSSIMARGDRVIAVSQTALDYCQDNYSSYLQSPPKLIYRGINPKEFPFGFEADVMWLQNWYEKNHQLVGHKIVLLPGRLTALKGVKDMLTWLKTTENDAKLVLTADPESDMYAARLYHWFKKQGVERRIHWVGLHSSMAELYAIADVVVSTSVRPESFGRTVLESLSIGTPVVAYNHGGVGEILSKMFPQGKIELGNGQQLADGINQMLADGVQVKQQQPFLLEDMLAQTVNLYHEVYNDN